MLKKIDDDLWLDLNCIKFIKAMENNDNKIYEVALETAHKSTSIWLNEELAEKLFAALKTIEIRAPNYGFTLTPQEWQPLKNALLNSPDFSYIETMKFIEDVEGRK